MKWIALLPTLFLMACMNKCLIESPQVNVAQPQKSPFKRPPAGSIDVTNTKIQFY